MNKPTLFRLAQLFILSNIIFWIVSCLLFYQIDVFSNQIEKGGDGPSYVIASKWLYEDGFWASAVRPFFYPLLIGLPKLLGFEINRLFTFFLNYMFWISTVYVLYFFIKSFLKEQVAFLCTLFFASCFGLYSLSFMSTPENCFTLVLLLHVVLLFDFFKKSNNKSLFISLFLLGLSIVVKPTLTLLLPIISLALLFFTFNKKLSYRAGFVCLFLLFSMPTTQIINMKRCYGNYAISYISHEVWYFFSGSYSYNKPTMSNFNIPYYADVWFKTYKNRIETYQKFTKDTSVWHQFILKSENDFKDQLNNNTLSVFFTLFRDLISNSIGGTPEIKEAQNIKKYRFFSVYQKIFFTISQCQNILNSFFIIFFCPFIFIIYRKKRNLLKFYQLIGMLYAWFIAFCILVLSSFSFTQGDRFHVVTVPLSLTVFAFLYSIFTKPIIKNVQTYKI